MTSIQWRDPDPDDLRVGEGEPVSVVSTFSRIGEHVYVVAVEIHLAQTVIDLILVDGVERVGDDPDKPLPEVAGFRHGELEDDVGTTYTWGGGGGTGERNVRRMAIRFAPAVPPEARRLTFRTRAGEARIDL
jgi:hypothetical protein